MIPFEPVTISDDDEPDPQQTLSRGIKALDEKMNEVNEIVRELGVEVSSYAKLLKAAQGRLEKAREQKEQLVDEKQKLLNEGQRLLQLSVLNGPPLSLAHGSNNITPINSSDHTKPKHEPEPKSRALSSPTTQLHNTSAHSLTPAASTGKKPKLEYFGPFPITSSSSYDGDGEGQPGTWDTSTKVQKVRGRGRGRGSRRLYGGGLSGVRASISNRAPRTPRIASEEKEQSQQGAQTRKVRAHIYSPYYEASNSGSESEASKGRRKARVDTALATQASLQNIPIDSKTFSRRDISSIIGGSPQGTWCNVNPNKATVYKAGSYMALDRGLNHSLPKQPGQNGGVYVADWLRKEVGKTYQMFIKKESNHWLYYGKYMVSSIREVSLAEWGGFGDIGKNRWAEHMLEHQWGKNIILKKKLMTEQQCIKPNWEKVLGLFNRADNHPNLRLKILALHFISYDRALYDTLNSMTSDSALAEKQAEGKRRYSDYDEDESDSYT